LWHKGYYITEGSKFGADYLVYSGDPSCFHAQFLVLVKQYTEFFIADEMVTLTRLANSVKKKVVLATLSDMHDKPKVIYNTVEWLGVT